MDIITPVLDAVLIAPGELDILGELHPADIGQEWMDKGTYRFYWAIGRAFRPESYIEIGVRFGYSIQSIAAGSGQLKTVYGFDNEYDMPGSLSVADARVRGLVRNTYFTKADSQTLETLGRIQADLAHVDGMHTRDGVYHDCELAIEAIKPGGILLIDDVGGDAGLEVRRGSLDFCEAYKLTPHYLHCYHGMYLIRKPA